MTHVLVAALAALTLQQAPPGDLALDAYQDDTARELVVAARRRWKEVDQSLLGYTATIRERLAVGLRAFRRDRTLFHWEQASRVRWFRDDRPVVQMLAARQEHPGGMEIPRAGPMLGGSLFDPERDPLLFGLTGEDGDRDDGDFRVEHPLEEGSEAFYRYRTGDTLRIALPDRTLRAIEVQVLPRERAIHLLTGSLWIDPETGGLVRAAFRLSRSLDIERDWELIRDESDPDTDEAEKNMSRLPGLFKPLQMELRMVVVEYALWGFKYWLPRTMRAEGEARAGVVRAPASLEVSYQIEDAYGEDERDERLAAGEPMTSREVVDAWNPERDHRVRSRREGSRRIRMLVPYDEERLAESPDLPPPIWEDIAPAISDAELQSLFRGVAALPQGPLLQSPWVFSWGYTGHDLLRYNRVEGLSVGARVEHDFGAVQGDLTLRMGVADPTPDVSLTLLRDRPRRRLGLTLRHGLQAVDVRGRALGFGNSASALLLGRDDGEYFRAWGAALEWRPPSTDRDWFVVRLYGERQRAVDAETDVALPAIWSDDVFRPNIAADRADQIGSILRLTPWWGSDRSRVQAGLDLYAQAATGDFQYARTGLTVTGVAPLGGRLHAGLEVAGGTAWGDLPVQRFWYLGGGSTLRGYPGSTLVGSSFARGRLELARGVQAYGVALFGDWAWAGERGAFDVDDGLYSVGVGFTTLDGLVRIDLARGLVAPTGWRLELHLDGLL